MILVSDHAKWRPVLEEADVRELRTSHVQIIHDPRLVLFDPNQVQYGTSFFFIEKRPLLWFQVSDYCIVHSPSETSLLERVFGHIQR